jgi:hypothetical protein
MPSPNAHLKRPSSPIVTPRAKKPRRSLPAQTPPTPRNTARRAPRSLPGASVKVKDPGPPMGTLFSVSPVEPSATPTASGPVQELEERVSSLEQAQKDLKNKSSLTLGERVRLQKIPAHLNAARQQLAEMDVGDSRTSDDELFDISLPLALQRAPVDRVRKGPIDVVASPSATPSSAFMHLRVSTPATPGPTRRPKAKFISPEDLSDLRPVLMPPPPSTNHKLARHRPQPFAPSPSPVARPSGTIARSPMAMGVDISDALPVLSILTPEQSRPASRLRVAASPALRVRAECGPSPVPMDVDPPVRRNAPSATATSPIDRRRHVPGTPSPAPGRRSNAPVPGPRGSPVPRGNWPRPIQRGGQSTALVAGPSSMPWVDIDENEEQDNSLDMDHWNRPASESNNASVE